MTVDSAIQLLRTSSLPRLREHLNDCFSHDQIFFEKLVNLLSASQPLSCHHEWEQIGPPDHQSQRCKVCGKTLLIPRD